MEDYTASATRGVVSDHTPAIDCARWAAQSELGTEFAAAGALVGYGERSVLFFAEDAVLKVYTHRPHERMRRELAGLRAAAGRPGLRVPEVQGYADAPGALAWMAIGRLAGTNAAELDGFQAGEETARTAARLHTAPLHDLAGLEDFALRLREEPVADPQAERARVRLTTMTTPVAEAELARCVRGFVHGDFSARNVLLAPGTDPAVIDFEGCGIGCTYEDLAKLHLNEVVIAGREEALLAKTYAEECAALGHTWPGIDSAHLYFHLARHARWVLQWAPAIDTELNTRVLDLVPRILAGLPAAS